jgi:hypothetical protein
MALSFMPFSCSRVILDTEISNHTRRRNAMKKDSLRRGRAVLTGLTLMTGLTTGLLTSLSAVPALAQFPGGGGGGFPGGGGGFQGRPPFAFGAVSAVDTGAGTITIMPQFGGNGPQTIKVDGSTQIVTLADVAVADLKVGDKIVVQGIPTGITASSVTVGDPPPGLPGLPGMGGGFGGPRGGGGNGGGNAAGAPAPPTSSATATGTIKVLPTAADPHLTLSLGPDMELFLKIADGAKVTKYMTLKLADIKTGDRVMAAGQTADDGTLTATTLGVNLPQPRGGGRGGRGGFGGPGGPGGGPGGFGGGPGGGGPPPPDAPPPPQ